MTVPSTENSSSYTIETVAKSKDGTEDTATHTVTVENPNVSDDDTENSGSGVIAGPPTEPPTTDDGSQTGDEPVEDVITQIRQTDPDVQTEVAIEDTDAERGSVTVDTTDTDSVEQITFNDDSVTGTVTIKEYQTLPEEVTNQIGASVAEVTESTSDGSETDSSDGQTASSYNVVSVTDISPSSESATETAATITLTVDRDDLTTPNNAYIIHETDDGWEPLSTTVAETEDGTVTLEATTDSFSLFGVVEREEPSQTAADSRDRPAEPDDAIGPTAIAGILAALTVLAVAFVLYRRL
jgi:hypothetical protein